MTFQSLSPIVRYNTANSILRGSRTDMSPIVWFLKCKKKGEMTANVEVISKDDLNGDQTVPDESDPFRVQGSAKSTKV